MGFATQLMSAANTATSYDNKKHTAQNKAKLARVQGEAELAKGKSEAAATRQAARMNAEIAGQQLRQARKEQRKAEGSARAAQSASGFSTDGTAEAGVDSVNEMYNSYIANMAQSSSIGSINAEQRAVDAMRAGEAAQKYAEVEAIGYDSEAAQYNMLAKNTRNDMWRAGIAGVVGTAFGGITGYNAGGLGGMMMGMNDYGNMGWDMTSSFSPYLGQVDAAGSYKNFMALFNSKNSGFNNMNNMNTGSPYYGWATGRNRI